MTTLSDIAAQLADRRTIDRSSAVALVLDQIVCHDLIRGLITDPKDITAGRAHELLNDADEAYSAAEALALGETARPAPGVVIVPVAHD